MNDDSKQSEHSSDPNTRPNEAQAYRRGKWARRGWMSMIGTMGLLLLFSHQNCAPARSISGSSSAATGTQASSPVTIIDDSKSDAAVSFAQPQIAVKGSSASVDVSGSCSLSQNDSVLGWQLMSFENDSSGPVLQRGYASCEKGVFIAHLGAGSSFACGQKFELVAQLGFGTPGAIELDVNCD